MMRILFSKKKRREEIKIGKKVANIEEGGNRNKAIEVNNQNLKEFNKDNVEPSELLRSNVSQRYTCTRDTNKMKNNAKSTDITT